MTSAHIWSWRSHESTLGWLFEEYISETLKWKKNPLKTTQDRKIQRT